jgi:hypothetical protein
MTNTATHSAKKTRWHLCGVEDEVHELSLHCRMPNVSAWPLNATSYDTQAPQTTLLALLRAPAVDSQHLTL